MVTPCHSLLEIKLNQDIDRLPTWSPPFNWSGPGGTSEIIRITKRLGGWSAQTKYVASYPNYNPLLIRWDGRLREDVAGFTGLTPNRVIGGFGGILNGALIVGNHKSVYQYNVDEDKWIDIDEHSKHYYNEIWRTENRNYAKGCSIGESFLVYGEKAELLQFRPWLTKLYDSTPNESTAEVISEVFSETKGARSVPKILVDDNTRPRWKKIVDSVMAFAKPPNSNSSYLKRKPPIRMLRNQCFCNTPKTSSPVLNHSNLATGDIYGHSITNIAPDKVLLIKGNQMFLGQLTWDKWNMKWKKLEGIRMRHSGGRTRHIAFKMKDHVYVAGGVLLNKIEESRLTSSCEKYNVIENKWSSCKYSLPYALEDASVVVSPDESYAIITGGMNQKSRPTNGIIIFDEKSGFKLISDKMLCKRSMHVSMPVL